MADTFCTVRFIHPPTGDSALCGRPGAWEVCQGIACDRPGHLEEMIKVCEEASPAAPHEVRSIP